MGAEGGEEGAPHESLGRCWGEARGLCWGGARGPEPGTGCSGTLRAQVKVAVARGLKMLKLMKLCSAVLIAHVLANLSAPRCLSVLIACRLVNS